VVCENVTDGDEEVDNVVVSREEDEGKEGPNVVVSGVELDVDAEPLLAVEDIELVSPQIDAMLLLSVLMYPVNFVSFSSK